MDYIGRTMNICLILFMIFTTSSHCQYYNNRDIILTPNHLKTYPGKVLYYRPHEQGTLSEEKPNTSGSPAVPWEEVLKETVFLALNENKTSLQQQASGSTDNALLLANRQHKAIYNAPYIGAIGLDAPLFGDIVELAHGRLEHDGDESYSFVQQEGGNNAQPQRNVMALWKVERIRHRDNLRGHRYELKFTIAPTRSRHEDSMEDGFSFEAQQDLGDKMELPSNRTFIVRDEDYPKYFAPLIMPNVIPMLRKNDQMYDRTFFDLIQPQTHQQSQFGAFSPPARFYRPAMPHQQQTITLGQYLVQSLLSGGESPKYHHHHHHVMPGKLLSPGFFGGFSATNNRIKFPDSFTGSSQAVPKFYQHIHFQRPSIAPLAPTALPGSYLFHHHKDVHTAAPSNANQDYTKVTDLRGPVTTTLDSVGGKLSNSVANIAQKAQSPSQNQVSQTQSPQKIQQNPQQFSQQHQQQFHQVATPGNEVGQPTANPAGAQQNILPQQFPPQPNAFYRTQVPSQHQQPIMIHPHLHPQLAAGGPAQFFSPFAGPGQSHLIQSIPFYNPQGQMVLNHIPVMPNHHVIQMSPSQPIAIPVHVQLIPPVAPAAQLYAPPPQQQPQHQSQPHQQQDGPVPAIPVRIMQSISNPVHLYSPVNPFLPPLQTQQQQLHHYNHQHHQHHPLITVTPKITTNYQQHQHHPRPANAPHSTNNQSVATPPTIGHLTHPPTQTHHSHTHPHSHPHNPHSFNAIPTVFKFTSSNAIHPQKANSGAGGGSGGSSNASGGPTSPPTLSANHATNHRYNTPNVQISGPSISPTPPATHQRHRFSTPGTAGIKSSSIASSSPSPTSATRPSARYTPAVGQVSGPTVSSTAANHRYASLPTVPASPAGLREKFTASSFQPAASESKQSSRKLEPPTNVADAVGSPSNAVSPKYESFGVENAVTPTIESLLLLTPSSTSPEVATSSLPSSSQKHSPAITTKTVSASATASTTAVRTTHAGGAFSYNNFIDASGAVSVAAKLTSEQTSPSMQHHRSSYIASHVSSPTTPISITTQSSFIPKPKTYIQQLGPTIGVKYPPAFKSMPSVTILPPQIETPIASTLKTYQYLNHHDTYDFIPSRVVELAHVKKMNGHKQPKRNKQNKPPQKTSQKAVGPQGGIAGMAIAGPVGGHHHHVTVTSSKPLRFYPGDGSEFATHRPEAQLSVQLPPPEKDFTMTYYGTQKHNQKVQRPKNYVTPLHSYQGTSTTPLPATLTTSSSLTSTSSSVSSTPIPVSAMSSTPSSSTQDFGRNVTTSTFRSATASNTVHYFKNRHEKSDDLSITTMRPRMILKTIYRQFPGSFVSSASSSSSTEKPVQKWVPKRPRTSNKSTSGEFSTSTLPSSALTGGIEQAVASSERDVVTKTPVVSVVSIRPTHDQQMQRVRASRGRSRYTYRRMPSGNPPPMPTGQQQSQPSSSRTSRMRNSNFNVSTTTIKPVPSVTSSVFDSNRIDGRSFEQQERKAEETVMTTTPKNGSNEKIKRDASEEATRYGKEDFVHDIAVAEQLTAKQVESQQDPLEVTEPEKEYVMVKANIEPIVTNQSNVVFFEASDAATIIPVESGRTAASGIDDLTMSIINHAKAIVNQTDRPIESVEDTTPTTPTPGIGKPVESNEIAHKEEPEVASTVELATTTIGSTSSLMTESTVSDAIMNTTIDEDELSQKTGATNAV